MAMAVAAATTLMGLFGLAWVGGALGVMMMMWLWLLLRQWRCGAVVEEGPAVKAATNVVVVVVVDFNKNKTLQHAVKTMFTKRMI